LPVPVGEVLLDHCEAELEFGHTLSVVEHGQVRAGGAICEIGARAGLTEDGAAGLTQVVAQEEAWVACGTGGGLLAQAVHDIAVAVAVARVQGEPAVAGGAGVGRAAGAVRGTGLAVASVRVEEVVAGHAGFALSEKADPAVLEVAGGAARGDGHIVALDAEDADSGRGAGQAVGRAGRADSPALVREEPVNAGDDPVELAGPRVSVEAAVAEPVQQVVPVLAGGTGQSRIAGQAVQGAGLAPEHVRGRDVVARLAGRAGARADRRADRAPVVARQTAVLAHQDQRTRAGALAGLRRTCARRAVDYRQAAGLAQRLTQQQTPKHLNNTAFHHFSHFLRSLRLRVYVLERPRTGVVAVLRNGLCRLLARRGSTFNALWGLLGLVSLIDLPVPPYRRKYVSIGKLVDPRSMFESVSELTFKDVPRLIKITASSMRVPLLDPAIVDVLIDILKHAEPPHNPIFILPLILLAIRPYKRSQPMLLLAIHLPIIDPLLANFIINV
jgi:hypothetical protein